VRRGLLERRGAELILSYKLGTEYKLAPNGEKMHHKYTLEEQEE
jgi:hypothetical protein